MTYITETMSANHYARLGAANGEGYSYDDTEDEDAGTYAAEGEDARFLPADLVSNPDEGHVYGTPHGTRWQGGQNEPQW